MNPFATAFSVPLDNDFTDSVERGKIVERRLSNLKDYFFDQQAVSEILKREDPLIYQVWEREYQGAARGMSLGMTRILPGTVGKEFYFTRGHFHSAGDGDECYIVLEGKGAIMMYARDGDCQVVEMLPGRLYYVPGHLAHRTLNISNEDFVFLTIWPPFIEHDYASIAKTGFPRLVLRVEDGIQVIANPGFKISG